jgi:hypothetical protein
LSASTPVSDPARGHGKRPFVRPQLTRYGALGRVTMTSSSCAPSGTKSGPLDMGSAGLGKGGWFQL